MGVELQHLSQQVHGHLPEHAEPPHKFRGSSRQVPDELSPHRGPNGVHVSPRGGAYDVEEHLNDGRTGADVGVRAEFCLRN